MNARLLNHTLLAIAANAGGLWMLFDRVSRASDKTLFFIVLLYYTMIIGVNAVAWQMLKSKVFMISTIIMTALFVPVLLITQ